MVLLGHVEHVRHSMPKVTPTVNSWQLTTSPRLVTTPVVPHPSRFGASAAHKGRLQPPPDAGVSRTPSIGDRRDVGLNGCDRRRRGSGETGSIAVSGDRPGRTVPARGRTALTGAEQDVPGRDDGLLLRWRDTRVARQDRLRHVVRGACVDQEGRSGPSRGRPLTPAAVSVVVARQAAAVAAPRLIASSFAACASGPMGTATGCQAVAGSPRRIRTPTARPTEIARTTTPGRSSRLGFVAAPSTERNDVVDGKLFHSRVTWGVGAALAASVSWVTTDSCGRGSDPIGEPPSGLVILGGRP